jgi:ParB-like chromosome segregation protein Spo0J
MSPTHTTRNNRRHRYYVSQAVLQYREHEGGSVVRVPAQSVENVIVGTIARLLKTPNELLDAVESCKLSARIQKALLSRARALAEKWEHGSVHEQVQSIRTLVHKVTLARKEVEITLSVAALVKTLTGDMSNRDQKATLFDANRVIRVPVSLNRCGIETRFVVPTGDGPEAHPLSVQAIQQALAKALAWNHALVTGTDSSMTALAEREGVTQRYVARLVRLALLAPDIMEAIIRGNIPPALSLERLRLGFPLAWKEQRKTLGFS